MDRGSGSRLVEMGRRDNSRDQRPMREKEREKKPRCGHGKLSRHRSQAKQKTGKNATPGKHWRIEGRANGSDWRRGAALWQRGETRRCQGLVGRAGWQVGRVFFNSLCGCCAFSREDGTDAPDGLAQGRRDDDACVRAARGVCGSVSGWWKGRGAKVLARAGKERATGRRATRWMRQEHSGQLARGGEVVVSVEGRHPAPKCPRGSCEQKHT